MGKVNPDGNRLTGAAAIAAAAMLAFGLAHAQQGAAPQSGEAAKSPEFEVATIKPSKPGAVGSTFAFASGEGVKVTNGTLKGIIEMAYNVRDFQITGGPGWIDSQQFDVVAKSAASDWGSQAGNSQESIDETRLRIRALLALRFELKVHAERNCRSIFWRWARMARSWRRLACKMLREATGRHQCALRRDDRHEHNDDESGLQAFGATRPPCQRHYRPHWEIRFSTFLVAGGRSLRRGDTHCQLRRWGEFV